MPTNPGRNSAWPYQRGEENPFQNRTDNSPGLTARPSVRTLGEPISPGQASSLLPPGAAGFIAAGRPRGRFVAYPFNAGVLPIQIVPQQPKRSYLILINNSGAARIFVGFDYEPNAVNGVILELNLGFYEPWIVPTNSITVLGAGANTAGIALVVNEE